VAQVAVRFGDVGLAADGFLVSRHRFGHLALFGKGVAQVVV
jgi:hypothetical protein